MSTNRYQTALDSLLEINRLQDKIRENISTVKDSLTVNEFNGVSYFDADLSELVCVNIKPVSKPDCNSKEIMYAFNGGYIHARDDDVVRKCVLKMIEKTMIKI